MLNARLLKGMMVFLCGGHLSLLAGMDSAYTKIDTTHCTVIASDRGVADSSVSKCQPYAGIDVLVEYGDARDDIVLVRKGKPYYLDLQRHISWAFSMLGDTIEWRFPSKKPYQPVAMIVRFNAQDKIDKKGMPSNVSYLVVTKITDKEICIVGKIDPVRNQNLKARDMADRASTMACLKERQE